MPPSQPDSVQPPTVASLLPDPIGKAAAAKQFVQAVHPPAPPTAPIPNHDNCRAGT